MSEWRRFSPRIWLFDLDNTLHNASVHVFPHINRSMTAYIRDQLCINESEANRLRRDYWQRYGATLFGLMRHHAVKPDHFLWHTHQFPDLQQMLIFERTIKATLHRLPGRKIIFSNGPAHYTKAVIDLMGIRNCFDAVYSLNRFRYRAKPAPAGFFHLMRAERLNPRRCIMVEDSLANLETAKKLGMSTVWVSNERRNSPCVDIKIRSLRELPRRTSLQQAAPCRSISQ